LDKAETEEGEGMHDCTAVDNVHRQLFFMYILYFPLSFYHSIFLQDTHHTIHTHSTGYIRQNKINMSTLAPICSVSWAQLPEPVGRDLRPKV
jgi:uncharacterized protein YdeI (YjbR/CyaY-like superfamily)